LRDLHLTPLDVRISEPLWPFLRVRVPSTPYLICRLSLDFVEINRHWGLHVLDPHLSDFLEYRGFAIATHFPWQKLGGLALRQFDRHEPLPVRDMLVLIDDTHPGAIRIQHHDVQ